MCGTLTADASAPTRLGAWRLYAKNLWQRRSRDPSWDGDMGDVTEGAAAYGWLDGVLYVIVTDISQLDGGAFRPDRTPPTRKDLLPAWLDFVDAYVETLDGGGFIYVARRPGLAGAAWDANGNRIRAKGNRT